MSLFEDAVLFLARDRSVNDLSATVGIETRETTRVGVVLALPVVIANLTRWLEEPVGANWLTARLADVGDASVESFAELMAGFDIEEIGGGMLDVLLGDRRDDIGRQIAERAEISHSSADDLLSVAATTVLLQLSARHASGMTRAELVDELVGEREDLLEGGWGPWIAQTTLSPQPASLSELPPRPGGGYPPPVAVGRDRGDGRGREGSYGGVADDSGLYHDVVAPPGAGSGRGPVSAPSGRDDDRPYSDNLLRPISLLVVGVAVAAVFLIGFLLLRGDDDTQVTEALEETTVDEPTSTAEVEPADYGSSAESSVTSTTEPSDGGSAPGAVETISVVMDDPLGRTTGTGTALLSFDRQQGEVCYEFGIDGIGSPYDGHIHVGPLGVKGGIVIDFGELSGPASGCLDNRPVDTAKILDDLPGHYVEFHDPDDVTTIRAQLGSGDGAEPAPGAVDPDSGGAVIVIEAGAVILRGEVPDQVTIDKLIESFNDIDFGSTQLVDELVIVPDAPRPSGKIVVDAAIFFDFDSDELTDPDSPVLGTLATILTARPAWKMTVVGHTDSVGTEVYNLELSLRRAAAVRDALIAAGVSPEALTIEGAGATAPVADNGTPEGRSQNRRIEIEVVAG